jgi:hypothetical protein
MNQHNEMNTNHAKTLDSNYKKHIWWWHECPAVGQRSPLGLVDSHGEGGKGGFRVLVELILLFCRCGIVIERKAKTK